MAFLRVKKVKQWRYGYLVENQWKGSKSSRKGCRQKVKKYLGRVCQLEDMPGNFRIELDVENMELKDVIKELVIFELAKKGFVKKGNILKRNNLTADIEKGLFTSKGRNVVFEMNEGFLCSHTFNEMISFKHEADEEEVALKLAETLVEGGLNVPESIFVKLFEKVSEPRMEVVDLRKQSFKY